MTAPPSRPLSPHLSIYKWEPHMTVSILHRLTGSALTVVGLAVLTWWLLAIAQSGPVFADFVTVATHPVGMIVLVGLTWAFWQHFFSGLRHLVMDTGSGYELKINKLFAVLTIAAALFATAVTWFVLLGVNR
ncbi:MAG: succinate dehydrogenase, cytochrome b556 subunit [Sphingomonas bacterium]|nr:succinate dehydrogenase, cytochrome b556 subunit [Sphingomonas bacterium]